MPTTFFGLLLFVAFFVPGLVHYVTRKSLVPAQSKLSPVIETAQLVTVSLGVNVVSVAVFALLRSFPPARRHTPDVARLLIDPRAYVLNDQDRRLGYVLIWAMALVALSCLVAHRFARRDKPFGWLAGRFAPAIASSPAWYVAFERVVPSNARVFVGCALTEGGYVSGYLAWFSTESDETADRDLVLAPPLFALGADSKAVDMSHIERVVVSARNIQRIDVSYVSAAGSSQAG
jgi:hypothetical protein